MTIEEAAAHVHQNAPGMFYATSALNISAWRLLLEGHPEPVEVTRTLRGIEYGEPLGFEGVRYTHLARNPQHSEPKKRIIRKDAYKRKGEGKLLGGFVKIPTKFIRTSPQHVIPKGESDTRIIHDLSSPQGSSVSEGINMERYITQLNSSQEAMQGCRAAFKTLKQGQELRGMKFDWLDSFRQILIAPADIPLAAFQLDSEFWLDLRLPFGLRSSPAIFCRYAQQLKWIAQKKYGIKWLFNFYDDYFAIGTTAGEQEADRIFSELKELCKILGVATKDSKDVPPTAVLVYLGIEYDLVRMRVCIPSEKIAETLEKVHSVFKEPKITVRVAQSLLGSLVFVCSVVVSGNAFVSRIIARIRALGPLPAKTALVTVDDEFKCDLIFFMRFLPTFDGMALIVDTEWANITVEVDASGWGAGGFCESDWFSVQWSLQEAHLDISTQELIALVLACKAFGHQWKGKRVTIRSDSASVCAAVAKRRVRDRDMMKWIRELHFLEASGNFLVRAVHIAGVDNYLADSLSRNRIPTFHRDFHVRFQYEPHSQPSRVVVPSLTVEFPHVRT